MDRVVKSSSLASLFGGDSECFRGEGLRLEAALVAMMIAVVRDTGDARSTASRQVNLRETQPRKK